MKRRGSFDISDALQEGMNEFHRSCGYKIFDVPKMYTQGQTTHNRWLNISIKRIADILIDIFSN